VWAAYFNSASADRDSAGSEKEIARGERAGAAPGCDLGDSLTQEIFDRREVVRVCAAEIIFVVCDQHYDAV
jgi:hypothetical protein